MRLKTYFATSVEAAMARARIDLGSDAMLVHSRPAIHPKNEDTGDAAPVSPEANYEVVFAVEAPASKIGDAGQLAVSEKAILPALPSKPDASVDPVLIDHLRRDIQKIRQSLTQVAESIHLGEMSERKRRLAGKKWATAFAELRHCGFNDEFALDVVDACADAGREPTVTGLRVEIAGRLRCAPGVGRPASARMVVAFAGPAGSGKTTLCAKIAVRAGLALRRSTHLISIDSGRVGGSDLARTFGNLLGAGVTVIESPLALPHVLDQIRHADLILIDTPGFSPIGDTDGSDSGSEADDDFLQLAEALQSRPEIETQLVLPATFDSFTMSAHCRFFSALRPSRLVLTHLDAGCRLGPKIEFSIQSGLPLSYLSTGQNVPEDLAEANALVLSEAALEMTGTGLSSGSVAAPAYTTPYATESKPAQRAAA